MTKEDVAFDFGRSIGSSGVDDSLGIQDDWRTRSQNALYH